MHPGGGRTRALGDAETIAADELALNDRQSGGSPVIERRRGASSETRPSLDHFADKSQAALSETNLPRPIRNANRRAPASDFEIFITVGGKRLPFALLDVSNRGLAARLPANIDLESILPGRQVSAVSIFSGGNEVLSGVDTLVRRLTVCRTKGGAITTGYELGLEFVSERRTRRSEGQTVELKTPARIIEVIEEGLRNGLALTLLDSTIEPLFFSEGYVDSADGLIHLKSDRSDNLRPGDAVRATCDVTGFSCSFFTAVVVGGPTSASSVVLRVPRVIKTRRARSTHRLRPAPGNLVEVEMQSPFDSGPLRVPVLDVNSSGVSFAVDRRANVIPVGTVIEPLTLHFPDGRETAVRGRVRSLAPTANLPGAAATLRCGVEFESLPDEAKTFLADDVVRSARPSLANTQGVEFSSLWAFLRETGFLYPEKLDELASLMPEIEHTFACLLNSPQNQLLKTIVCRRNDELLGHISTLKLYRKTWLIQHLASRRQVEAMFAAEVLNLGLIEYLEQIPQLEWCRVYFRPNNRWPARVFGTFAKRLNEPSLSDLRHYNYCAGPTQGGITPVCRDLHLMPAGQAHLEEIQRHFIANGRVIALQADDLSLDRLMLGELNGIYGTVGLERRREIIVAERGSSFEGFALLEISSPGLNLSELTNHFTVHLANGGTDTRRALIAAARDRYRGLGRSTCVSLSEGDEVEDHEMMGLRKLKEYFCWTGHRSLLRAYSNYILRLFGQAKL
jgi:hypothetical protein